VVIGCLEVVVDCFRVFRGGYSMFIECLVVM